MDLIQQGIEKGLIRFDEDRKNIFYIHQDKRRNYNNPEEQVQAETFLKLVLEYGYSVTHIQQFVSVKMGLLKLRRFTKGRLVVITSSCNYLWGFTDFRISISL